MKHFLNITIILAMLLFTACDKKQPAPDPATPAPEQTNTPETGTFFFHLHTYIEDNEVDAYNIVYTNLDGRKVALSMAQLYISNIQLVKKDGTVYDIPNNKKILKVLDVDQINVADVPVGEYKSIRFKVGLDANTNQLNPSASPDSVLLKTASMWFGAAPQPDGYVFLNVQGKIDTTYDASATVAQMQPFVFKIGTNANYKQVSMPDKNFTVVKDQAVFGHIIIDYYKLFAGVALNHASNLSVTTASANNVSPATTIANNIPLMFRYEE